MKKRIERIKSTLDKFGEKISEQELINFDYRSILLFVFVFLSFSFLVAYKINYASINQWSEVVRGNDKKDQSLLLGAPKGVRGDEWNVVTPFILSQANQNPRFPVENESLGGSQTPLLMSLPVAHFSVLFRPQNWGFFTLDLERAYAFYWNFKVFGLFVGFFLLLMLLTGSNFWLSIFGSLWLLFSSFVQWWFSTPAMLPEMIASFSLAVVGFSCLFLSSKKSFIWVGALLSVVFSINFVLFFYPPFQIPLAYLGLALVIGLFVQKSGIHKFKKYSGFRTLVFFLALVIIGFSLFSFFADAREGISLLRNTVYPGERSFESGGLPVTHLFSGFYDSFFSEKSFPAKLENICEASNFIFLFPVIILIVLGKLIRKKKIPVLLSLVLGYLVLLTIWAIFGLPAMLNKLTLLNVVSSTRAFIGFGVASIIAVVVYMGGSGEDSEKKTLLRAAVYCLGIFFLAYWFGKIFNGAYDNYLKNWQISTISASLALITFFFVLRKTFPAALLILAAVIPFHFDVNPVVSGLDSVYGKNIVQYSKEIARKDPKARWIVMGKFSDVYSNLIKTSGAQVIDGVNFIPNFNILNTLDPESKNAAVYNRYAHIEYFPVGKGSDAGFNLKQTDKYSVTIDPCSEKIKKLGIKYLVLKGSADSLDLGCLELLTDKPLNQASIYKYKWQ